MITTVKGAKAGKPMKLDPDAVGVTDVMRRDVVTLRPDAPIGEAIELFEDRGISGAPVVDEDGEVRGVVSASDLLAVNAPGEETDAAAGGVVSDWMTPNVLSVGEDASLGEVCDLMNRETIHRVFVTRGRRLIGVVSTTDVVRHVARCSSAWSGDPEIVRGPGES